MLLDNNEKHNGNKTKGNKTKMDKTNPYRKMMEG
jgi:hypothetical protein